MTPEEYQPLTRLYDDVVALRDRFQRRHEQVAAHPADHTLNKAMLLSMDDIRERLLTYVEASAPLFSAQEEYCDQYGGLNDSAERATYLRQLVSDLRILSGRTMNRVSTTAPGSTARLSRMFAGTVCRERTDILDLADRLSVFVQQEQREAHAAASIQRPSASVVVSLMSRLTNPSVMGS